MSRLVIGGVLAFALLGLYVYVVVLALQFAHGCANTCNLSDGIASLLQGIGGLLSAVVIAELAVTKPGEAPGTRLAAVFPDPQKNLVKALAAFYILVWLGSGLALVIIGLIQSPSVPQVISVAKEWLGVAIAATYAYFGISQ